MYEFPYPSQRMPLFAKNVVATSQPLAAQAGLEMLRRGGNAVDAAVATAATLTVVEPTSNGIGSDAFAIIWDGHALHGLNASGRSPRRLSPERFANFRSMPQRGWDTVTVPGAVSAWAELARRFGRLPLPTVLEPAITYARDGFLVSPIIARSWANAHTLFGDRPDFVAAFLPEGRSPQAGSLWRCPDQADTLQAVAESGGESFYRGALAQAIAEHARSEGALLDEDDLAAHQAEWVEPIEVTFESPTGPVTLHEIPPNGQGLAALIALGIVSNLGLDQLEADDPQAVHLQAEAMKLAFADTYRYVADPEYLEFDVRSLLSQSYLSKRAAQVNRERAGIAAPGMPRDGGTVYLSAADSDGIMVSFIQSNYSGFGSGVVVPGTGISMQNRGAGFELTRNHPNEVGGGKRPFHTIIPGFLTRSGVPSMSFGVMGGPVQPQGHLQMVLRTCLWGQNVQAACDAPRWQVLTDGRVALETGWSRSVHDTLQNMGHIVTDSADDQVFGFGGAQLIQCLEHGYVAGSDPRKDGQAVGF